MPLASPWGWPAARGVDDPQRVPAVYSASRSTAHVPRAIPKSLVLYLLRHADSAASPHVPEPRWPLTARGQQQARVLVDSLAVLDIGVVYSSPYRRAVETVAPFARHQRLPVRLDPRFRERRLTDQWLDDHPQAVKRVWSDFQRTLPGGESSAACQRRMAAAVADVRARHPDRRLLISSHGNAIGLYLNHLDPCFGFQQWQAMQKPDLFAVHEDQWTRLAWAPGSGRTDP